MELILIILTSIVLISQFSLDFLLDFLSESKKLKMKNLKKTKILTGIIILIIGLIAIWINFIIQKDDKINEENRHNKENKINKKDLIILIA